MSTYDVDVAILGAGTAGMAAYRAAAKHTDSIALLDGGPLGTTCARVGCMPSKLLIAAANKAHAAQDTARFGIHLDPPHIDGAAVMQRVRDERDRFVGFVLDAVDDFPDRHVIREHAVFEDDHTLRLTSGRKLTARAIVIATGSHPMIAGPIKGAGDRLYTNDGIFDWQDLPESAAVFGAGIIGLELGQALYRLGVRTRLFGRNHAVGPISDPEVRARAGEIFEAEFSAHWHADSEVTQDGDGVIVRWSDASDEDAPWHEERFDCVVAATGRAPNVAKLGLDQTSLPLDQNGVPIFDRLSMRIGDSHIFMAGDCGDDLPLLHEASDEGTMAGENAALLPASYRKQRRTPLSIVFSDPQIALVGATHAELTESACNFAVGSVEFEDQGRSRTMGLGGGLLRIYAELDTGRVLGAEMAGPDAEHIGHLLAWAIEENATVDRMLSYPFYHPTLEEGLRTALRNTAAALSMGPKPPLRSIDCGPGA
ncbi:dihydrolipoyl dehydrogenase [Roseovarius nanhaiticus]|uniref:dihydrolipoyl dehydrogenase n=1 Tax=Roseovarius nanhaiticus TaxID=573024 RepID=UPI00248F6938|nr:dihydrolipoyl dehydrogenase [Roseovarius nanhaiticus]